MAFFVAFIVFMFAIAIAAMIELHLRKKAMAREIELYETKTKEYEGPRGETRKEERIIAPPRETFDHGQTSRLKPIERIDPMKLHDFGPRGQMKSEPVKATPYRGGWVAEPAISTKEHSVCSHSHDDGFALSMAVAAATDNMALGVIVGGNLTGAIVGDMLHDSQHDEPVRHETPVYEPEPEKTYSAPVYEAPSYESPSSSCDSSCGDSSSSSDSCSSSSDW